MAVKELENKIKSAVSSLSKPFSGIIPENLMPEHSKWEPDESSEDDPSPDPTPEPVVQYTLKFSAGDNAPGVETYPSSLTVKSGTVVDLTQYNPDPTSYIEDHTEGDPFNSYTFDSWYDVSTFNEDAGMYEYNIITSITMDSDKTVNALWSLMQDPGTPDPTPEEPIV